MSAKSANVRNGTLHAILEAFTADSAGQLSIETARGAEVPFEVIEEPGDRVSLYCYRPLTGAFIRERLGLLAALATYAPAASALTTLDSVETYLRTRGEARVPDAPRERADAALRCFLAVVFAERSEFGFDRDRFEAAYDELERALYGGSCMTTVIAPLLGVALDPKTNELALGDGLSLVRGDTLSDAPTEAVWGPHGPEGWVTGEPNVLAVLSVAQERSTRPLVPVARARFRRLLSALRLFERGGYAIGPVAWTRMDGGSWRPVAFSGSGRPRLLTLISAAQEDELRAFCNLVSRRAPSYLRSHSPRAQLPASLDWPARKSSGARPLASHTRAAPEACSGSGYESSGSGELAWAFARFEMGCERLAPFEALTDYLLALRALLEPEGPSSGRLAQRLAVICAKPSDQAALAERTAHAISLERAVVTGLAPAQLRVDALVDELAEHLRSLLRDVICGHLRADLTSVADELLAEMAVAPA
ncbi:MAG: hypothetical protein ACR2OB_13465 [Solirubrobacteraceae bacterium]